MYSTFHHLLWVGFSLSAPLTTVGSGIPEVKSILSGLHLHHYLSFRAFVAKTIGLICAVGAGKLRPPFSDPRGLSVGREGPYVMISAILANQLSKLKPFRRIRKDKSLKFQVLSAACAAGVATTFGAPVGGT